MQRIGLGGVQKIDADLATPVVVAARVPSMGPVWNRDLAVAVATARRLGLEFGIDTSPGWSQLGGPWVAPADAMHKLVWSSTTLGAGTARLPLPPIASGPFQGIDVALASIGPPAPIPPDYRDVAVVAYRTPPDALADARYTPIITASAGRIDAAALADGRFATAQRLLPGPGGAIWLLADFHRPRPVRAMTLGLPLPQGFGAPAPPRVMLQASADGVHFRTLADVPASAAPAITIDIPPAVARYFRLLVTPAPPPPSLLPPGVIGLPSVPPSPGTLVCQWRLSSAALVHHAEEKAGFAAATAYYALDTPPAPASSAVPLPDIVDLTGHMDPDGTLHWRKPAGQWTVLRFGQSLTGARNHPAPADATGLEVDKLDPARVAAYLATYLGKYRAATGARRLGAAGLNALVTDSTEAGPQNWTDTLADQFRARRHYDLHPFLPALAGVIVGDAATTDRFLYDFRRTIAEALAQATYRGIADAAHAQGMRAYGEALEDHRPQLGDDIDMRSPMDVPMGAMWVAAPGAPPRATFVADDRGAASVAHLYGQGIAGAESFTAYGQPWSFAPRNLKHTADLELALGINLFMIHESAHQPLPGHRPGLALAPVLGQYFNRNETWAEQARPWIDYLARSCFLLQQGINIADVAYFHGEDAPLTALFGEHPPADAPRRHAYDFIGADAVLHRLRVDHGLLAAGATRYRLLYLGGDSRRMTLPVLARLVALVRAGAVLAGPPPIASPALEDDAGFRALHDQLWPAGVPAGGYALGQGRVFTTDADEALRQIGVAPDVAFAPQADGLMSVHRHAAGADIYFIANQGAVAVTTEASFRLAGRAAELFRADDGTIAPIGYRTEAGRTLVTLSLAPDDAVFVVFRHPGPAARSLPVDRLQTIARLPGPWRRGFAPGMGAPTAPVPASLGSWTEEADPAIRYYAGTATYSTSFTLPAGLPARHRHILIDLGDVRDLAQLRVNGHDLGVLWKPPYRADISAVVGPGTNTLEIAVTNPWRNRLIGDALPAGQPRAYIPRPAFTADAILRPAGLIGPVTLIAVPRS